MAKINVVRPHVDETNLLTWQIVEIDESELEPGEEPYVPFDPVPPGAVAS